jgi:hypothetical protein
MSRFACPGRSSASSAWSRVDGLHPATGQRFAAVGEHAQGLEFADELQDAQGGGAHRDGCDRVRVVRVGLAVVAGVEEPDPGGELGRDVNDLLTVLEQSLRERSAGTVASLDRPDPPWPGAGVLAHRCVAGPVGGEPT